MVLAVHPFSFSFAHQMLPVDKSENAQSFGNPVHALLLVPAGFTLLHGFSMLANCGRLPS
jgi:hypothetical protein